MYNIPFFWYIYLFLCRHYGLLGVRAYPKNDGQAHPPVVIVKHLFPFLFTNVLDFAGRINPLICTFRFMNSCVFRLLCCLPVCFFCTTCTSCRATGGRVDWRQIIDTHWRYTFFGELLSPIILLWHYLDILVVKFLKNCQHARPHFPKKNCRMSLFFFLIARPSSFSLRTGDFHSTHVSAT